MPHTTVSLQAHPSLRPPRQHPWRRLRSCPAWPGRGRLAHVGLGALAWLLLAAGPAAAFTTFGDPSFVSNVSLHLQASPRWPSADGRSVTLEVATMPGWAAALGTTAEEIAAAQQVVVDTFEAWSSPALHFEVSHEDPGATGLSVPQPLTGFDIDVFAVPGTHPVFLGTTYFGVAVVSTSSSPSRLLTNGQAFPGQIINGADVYLNLDAILPLRTGVVEIDALALQRLLMHEVGHALGFGHPNNNNPFGPAANFDQDLDPLNPMPVDPNNPFAGLFVSAFPHNESVMSNRPCGEPPVLPCIALLNPLQPDDLGARDVLYPALCGNATVESPEECDDGNLVDGDGCDSNCTFTACGNGIATTGEQCDDGGTAGGDCCSPSCQFEIGPGTPGCCVSGVCNVSAACGAVCFGQGTCQLGGVSGDQCLCLQ